MINEHSGKYFIYRYGLDLISTIAILSLCCLALIQILWGNNAVADVKLSDERSQYYYWLGIESRYLSVEYGVNDEIGYADDDSVTHDFLLPINTLLQPQKNSIYLRATINSWYRDQITLGKAGDLENAASAEIYLRFKHKETGEMTNQLLLDVTYDPSSDEYRYTSPEANVLGQLELLPQNSAITLLPAEPLQLKEAGAKVHFLVNDKFFPKLYADGQIMEVNKELENEVKSEMERVFKLFDAKRYTPVIDYFAAPWRRNAVVYEYGDDAQSYADSIEMEDYVTNPNYEYFLDYSQSKLRLSANGKLISFYPAVLKAREPDGFVSIEFSVVFMKDRDGNLVPGA